MSSERRIVGNEVMKIEAVETEVSNMSESNSQYGDDYSKVLNQKIIHKQKKYNKVPNESKERLIKHVNSGLSIKEAADKCKIKNSTAKAIMNTYRKDGRIGKKKTDDQRPGNFLRQEQDHGTSLDNEIPKELAPYSHLISALKHSSPKLDDIEPFMKRLESIPVNNNIFIQAKVNELKSFSHAYELMGRLIELSKEEIIRTIAAIKDAPPQVLNPALPQTLFPSMMPQMPATFIQSLNGQIFNLGFMPK
eukprot:TRINITY_DN0_c332_g1_i2.p1 TRINITY_DN0_c332_g1~~TRINITY_DN0_c332_g1_i2.p1  ORF type:complete len:249 (+),score=64.37 TRINITY_DN0_c332_g1_i2:78-824(+)